MCVGLKVKDLVRVKPGQLKAKVRDRQGETVRTTEMTLDRFRDMVRGEGGKEAFPSTQNLIPIFFSDLSPVPPCCLLLPW